MFSTLNFISALSVIFPLASGISRYKILGKEYYILLIFFFVSFLVELTATILNFQSVNNLWLGNIFSLAECFFWGIIIRAWFPPGKIRVLILIFLFLFFSVWCYSTFIQLGLFQFNNYMRAVESVVFIFLSCFLLFNVSLDTSEIIFKNPKFWFGSGLLIYFSLNLIVFGTVNFVLSNHTQLMIKTWVIHSITNIIANLLFTTGFLCIKRKMI
jgi:hypothetical protein